MTIWNYSYRNFGLDQWIIWLMLANPGLYGQRTARRHIRHNRRLCRHLFDRRPAIAVDLRLWGFQVALLGLVPGTNSDSHYRDRRDH